MSLPKLLTIILLVLSPFIASAYDMPAAIDVEFDEGTLFPLNKRVCKNGDCTIAGMARNQIVLTFDDGPRPTETRQLLAVLERFGVKGTFFTHGIMAARYPFMLDEIDRPGHKLANHGKKQSPIHRDTDAKTVVSYLMQTHEIIKRYIKNDDIYVYRNPGGYWSRARARMLNRHPVLRNYVGPIYWNVGGDVEYKNNAIVNAADWKCQSDFRRGKPRYVRWNTKAELIENCALGYYRAIIKNYNSNIGSIVLMHDIHHVSPLILERFLQKLKKDSVDWEFIFVQDIPAVQNNVIAL